MADQQSLDIAHGGPDSDWLADKERWKPVPGHEGYSVSTMGRVRNDAPRYHSPRKPGDILKCLEDGDGYRRVSLDGKYRRVARLVLAAHRGLCPSGHQADHINRIRDDNRLENLRWVTPAQNSANADLDRGIRHVCAKLTEAQVLAIRAEYVAGAKLAALARHYGVGDSTVWNILIRRSWGHLIGDDDCRLPPHRPRRWTTPPGRESA